MWVGRCVWGWVWVGGWTFKNPTPHSTLRPDKNELTNVTGQPFAGYCLGKVQVVFKEFALLTEKCVTKNFAVNWPHREKSHDVVSKNARIQMCSNVCRFVKNIFEHVDRRFFLADLSSDSQKSKKSWLIPWLKALQCVNCAWRFAFVFCVFVNLFVSHKK